MAGPASSGPLLGYVACHRASGSRPPCAPDASAQHGVRPSDAHHQDSSAAGGDVRWALESGSRSRSTGPPGTSAVIGRHRGSATSGATRSGRSALVSLRVIARYATKMTIVPSRKPDVARSEICQAHGLRLRFPFILREQSFDPRPGTRRTRRRQRSLEAATRWRPGASVFVWSWTESGWRQA
jgi:hypothetical protein